jgi:hypothetical protein
MPVDLAIISLLAAWTYAFGTLIEIPQMGIGSQLANLMEVQAPHSRDDFLFAVRAIGNDITQAEQVMRLDYTAELIQIESMRMASGSDVPAFGDVCSTLSQ